MSYKDYWHSKYSLGQKPSEGLISLSKRIGADKFHFNRALDLGCGEGRNLSLIEKYSNYIVGIEPNYAAAKKADELNIANELVVSTLQQYCQNYQGPLFDLIIAWRVLHLGTLEQCLRNIRSAASLLSTGGHLALSVSDITCPYFEKTRSEQGGSEIEPGTILRTTRNNDIRHFFSMKELENINDSLNIVDYINFEERKGSSAEKIKKYHGVLYKNVRIN